MKIVTTTKTAEIKKIELTAEDMKRILEIGVFQLFGLELDLSEYQNPATFISFKAGCWYQIPLKQQ